MKYIFSLVFLVMFTGTALNAQQVFPVPDLVKQSFDQQYPDATDLKWSGGLDNHIVRFTLGERKLKANYTPKGDWVSTEERVKLETLPEVVQKGFQNTKYKDWAVKDIITVTKPRAVANEYFIIVQKSALNKKKLVFDAKGRLYEELISL
ncbi:MAG: PepSY-like domain-containing protein [Lacibacter sp.]|nr:PepSY-like domain-containing protein [Lacibacter sp.]